MARPGDDYDSASSQFFIVQEDSTYLDGQYAVFGYVTEGLEVVDAVCEAAEPTMTMEQSRRTPSRLSPPLPLEQSKIHLPLPGWGYSNNGRIGQLYDTGAPGGHYVPPGAFYLRYPASMSR